MIKKLLFILITASAIGCSNNVKTEPEVASVVADTFINTHKTQDTFPVDPNYGKDSGKNVSYKIIDGEAGTFGYDIYMEEKLVIHQPIIPGKPGTKGFAKKETAEKIASLVSHKVKFNMMPPTVSMAELDSLAAE